MEKQDPIIATTPKETDHEIEEIVVTVSISDLARVFTEWDRRYRADPDDFMSIVAHLLDETSESYGDACAPYFVQLLEDLVE